MFHWDDMRAVSETLQNCLCFTIIYGKYVIPSDVRAPILNYADLRLHDRWNCPFTIGRYYKYVAASNEDIWYVQDQVIPKIYRLFKNLSDAQNLPMVLGKSGPL